MDGGYTVTDPRSHRTWRFADHGPGLAVLEQMDDRNGNWIAASRHDEAGVPSTVVHSGGYRLRIDSADGRVTGLYLTGAGEDGSDLRLVRYGYTQGDLTEVRNSSGLTPPVHLRRAGTRHLLDGHQRARVHVRVRRQGPVHARRAAQKGI